MACIKRPPNSLRNIVKFIDATDNNIIYYKPILFFFALPPAI